MNKEAWQSKDRAIENKRGDGGNGGIKHCNVVCTMHACTASVSHLFLQGSGGLDFLPQPDSVVDEPGRVHACIYAYINIYNI